MTEAAELAVYLETGSKRSLAGTLDWPGLYRGGRDEATALAALAAAWPRYAPIAEVAGLTPPPAAARLTLVVVERVTGNASTEFGAPGTIPARDRRPVAEAEIVGFQRLLEAAWGAFDAAVAAAEGRTLRRGPRGGGRELAGIVEHVVEAERTYLARLAWPYRRPAGELVGHPIEHIRQQMLAALAAAARGELPSQGPRGGQIWPPRFFLRYVTWHLLDHTWEIGERSAG
jgi:hypothetical protein